MLLLPVPVFSCRYLPQSQIDVYILIETANLEYYFGIGHDHIHTNVTDGNY